MNKSRRGMALIMAMVVVLVGGAIIAITFDIVFRHAWLAQEEKVGFVDHTTMIDAVQSEKARIVQANIIQRSTPDPGDPDKYLPMLHAEGLEELQERWPRFPPAPPPLTSLEDFRLYEVEPIILGGGIGGAGRQRVTVDIYDMFFDPAWVDYDALSPDELRELPSVFHVEGDSWAGEMAGEGGHTAPGTGTRDEDVGGGHMDPDYYGAYLVRARLYDNRGHLIRTAEEAFVHIIYTPPDP